MKSWKGEGLAWLSSRWSVQDAQFKMLDRDWCKKRLLAKKLTNNKNPQFLSNQAEIQEVILMSWSFWQCFTIIGPNCGFLLLAYFLASNLFLHQSLYDALFRCSDWDISENFSLNIRLKILGLRCSPAWDTGLGASG